MPPSLQRARDLIHIRIRKGDQRILAAQFEA